MNFGNISGLVNGTESVVFDYEVTGSAVSSIDTGNILNGDEDGWYTVIARHIYDTADSTLQAYFNADSTAGNYGYRGITAANTTVANVNSTSALIRLAAVASGSTSGFSILRFYAKQGAVRMLNGTNVCNINGTTVTQLETIGSVYSVTNTNITGIVFAPSAGKCGVGTRIIILKSNNFTNGTPTGVITTPYIKGAWVRVGSQILSSTSSSVTFSALDGNRDVLYRLVFSRKAANVAASQPMVIVNNDTGSNYGAQMLYGSNTTILAVRQTNTYLYSAASASDFGESNLSEHIIFASTGHIRPVLSSIVDEVSGTTVDFLASFSQVWNNTVDNITSISVLSSQTNGHDTGSHFDLYALRPNG